MLLRVLDLHERLKDLGNKHKDKVMFLSILSKKRFQRKIRGRIILKQGRIDIDIELRNGRSQVNAVDFKRPLPRVKYLNRS